MKARAIVLALLAFLSYSCALNMPTPTAPFPVEVSPSPALDPWIAESMRFRRAVALRADEAWVRLVASNPAAVAGTETYEIPLLPEELAQLQGHLQNLEDALALGRSYGAEFQDGFAGAKFDAEVGRLVLMYTKDINAHQDRLALMRSAIVPEVRQATWPLAELEELAAQITPAATPDPRIHIYGAIVDVLANRVRVSFGSPNPEMGDAILARFDTTGRIALRWEGPYDPVIRPVGGLVVAVVDASGTPIQDIPCRYTSLDPLAPGDGGADTSKAGQCHFLNLPWGRYRIDILEADERVDRVIASVEVDVIAGVTRPVRLTIETD